VGFIIVDEIKKFEENNKNNGKDSRTFVYFCTVVQKKGKL